MYPVIKIIEKTVKPMKSQKLQIGMIVPTVAMYVPNFDDDIPHWDDFDPRPVSCATGSEEEMQRVVGSFKKSDMTDLKKWLKEVPKPYEPGLYHIEKYEEP